MKLRVVDHVLSRSGGERFVVQLIRAIAAADSSVRITVVSHGATLTRYRRLFAEHEIPCEFASVSATRRSVFTSDPYRITSAAMAGGDVVWIPWLHGHTISAPSEAPIFGSFHDGICFTEPRWVCTYPHAARAVLGTVREWIDSQRQIVCSSRFWAEHLIAQLGADAARIAVVPLSGDHQQPHPSPSVSSALWPWLNRPFLLCAASLSLHKNHEVLFEGYSTSGISWPLVLCGVESDFKSEQPLWRGLLRGAAVRTGTWPESRTVILKQRARELGLDSTSGLIALGHLPDDSYNQVLSQAAALVVPSLTEGGGSFPAEEAVLRGIPVICSDIPMIREQMDRLGARPLWFDPHSPLALANCLAALQMEYPGHKTGAVAQIPNVNRRSWRETATEYLNLFYSALESSGKNSARRTVRLR